MKKSLFQLFIFSTSLLLTSCSPHYYDLVYEMEGNEPLGIDLPVYPPKKLRGSLEKGRYYSEDGTFDIIANLKNTNIREETSPFGYTVVFEGSYNSPTIRYDIFPIENLQFFMALACDINTQKEFLKEFFHANILSAYQRKCPEIELVCEEILEKNDNIYFLSFLRGPLAPFENARTGKPSEDYIGMILAIKETALVAITMQKGLPFSNIEFARKSLQPSLEYYFEDCNIKIHEILSQYAP